MKKIGVLLFVALMMVQSIGGSCGCEAWCRKKGQQYGICGDGHTCVCSATPITDAGKLIIIKQFKVQKKN